MKLLHIDASARGDASVSRTLSAAIVAKLGASDITRRDLAAGLPVIDEAWVEANFTPVTDRTPEQNARLALSDTLLGELQQADTLVIGTPIYNFALPASLKAWIDLISRSGVAFTYSADGPQGLLTGKRAIVAIASGGTKTWSEIDFATPYLKHVLGFVGITDVTFVEADALGAGTDEKVAQAKDKIASLAA